MEPVVSPPQIYQSKCPPKQIRAGFENLCLKVSPQINKQHMRYKTAIQEYMLEPQTGPNKFAMLNLLGVIVYQDGDIKRSIECFKSVLKEDQENLNALASLEYVYRELNCTSEAERYMKELERLTGGNELSKEERKRRGRCLFEQGYMIAFDVHVTTKQEKRGQNNIRAHQTYMQAWQEAGDLIDYVERTEWCFLTAHNLYGIFTNPTALKALQLDRDSVSKVLVILLHEVTQCEDSHYKAQGWLFLGWIMNKLGERKNSSLENKKLMTDRRTSGHQQQQHLQQEDQGQQTKQQQKQHQKQHQQPQQQHHHQQQQQQQYKQQQRHQEQEQQHSDQNYIFEICESVDPSQQENWHKSTSVFDIIKAKGLECHVNNPEFCFLLATKYSPKRTDVLNRHANFLRQRNDIKSKDFDYAKDILMKSIELNSGESNWFAYQVLADLHKNTYRGRWYDKVNKGVGELPEMDLAMRAQNYYKEAIKRNPTPQLYANLAEISHFLGIDENRNVTDEDQMLHALINFKYALESLDGEKDPSIHQRRGRCLRDFKQEKSAAESFKKAIETQWPKSDHIFSYRWLIEILTHWCYKSKNKLRESGAMTATIGGNIDEINTTENKAKHTDAEAAIKRNRGELQYWFSVGCAKFSPKRLDEEMQRFWDPNDDKITGNPDVMVDLYRDLLKNGRETEAERLKKGLIDLVARPEDDKNGANSEDREGDNAEQSDMAHQIPVTASPRDGTSQTVSFSEYMRKLEQIKDNCQKIEAQNESLHKQTGTNEDESVADENRDCQQQALSTEPTSKTSVPNSSGDIVTYNVNNDVKDTRDVGTMTDDLEGNAAQKNGLSENLKFERSDSTLASIPMAPSVARNKKGKKYDFYVIYSDKDQDWVFYHLLTTLEGTKEFKGCVKERDFLPGAPVIDSVIQCIQESSKILVIVSAETGDDDGQWNYEVDQAILERMSNKLESFVIPVCKERQGIPEKLRDVNPCYMVRAHDWERLDAALDDPI